MEFNAQCVSKYEKGFLALPLIDSDFLWSSMNNITIFQLAINRVEEKLKITMCGACCTIPENVLYSLCFNYCSVSNNNTFA